MLCGFYLIFISTRYVFILFNNDHNKSIINQQNNEYSIYKVIILLAITDLAFSIDSITAAVSISDQLLLVVTGAIIGVIALRFTSSLFVRWLEVFSRLEIAGYLAIGFIGFKLILEIIFTNLIIQDYIVFLIMAFLLTWGFSKKNK